MSEPPPPRLAASVPLSSYTAVNDLRPFSSPASSNGEINGPNSGTSPASRQRVTESPGIVNESGKTLRSSTVEIQPHAEQPVELFNLFISAAEGAVCVHVCFRVGFFLLCFFPLSH